MNNYTDEAMNYVMVIDNGSGSIKAGTSAKGKPDVVFPSCVGKLKFKRVIPTAELTPSVYVGSNVLKEDSRGLLQLKYPIRHGIIEDWKAMEDIWNQVYKETKCKPEEHPVLLTEAPLNPRSNRERAAEVFFEAHNAPAFFVGTQAVLALYSSGRTSGIVLDVGDGVSHCVPVADGFAMPHAISRVDLAGRDVTDFLQLQLRRSGYTFTTSAEREIVRDIKEKLCQVSAVPIREDFYGQAEVEISDPLDRPSAGGADGGNSGNTYVLPDGSKIAVGSERLRAPELLFNPSIVGVEAPGVHEALVSSISKCDLDLRRMLYGCVFLSGGTTLLKGFPERLLHETKRIAPKESKIRISASAERQYSTWLGGSILATLSSFKHMWVTKSEWEAEGPRILHKKCL